MYRIVNSDFPRYKNTHSRNLIHFPENLITMADWNKSKTESWRSSVNRFCKYCKCWVSDNKASWAGHEQGARHKKAVEDKLMEMKRQTMMNQKHGQVGYLAVQYLY